MLVEMRLLVPCFLLLPLCAFSQSFTGLATNYDGSVLYFASSARQAGTTQTFNSKVYRWDAAFGVRVAVEQPDKGEDNFCVNANFYDLTAPQISSDGAVLAYTGARQYTGPTRFCAPRELNQGTVLRTGKAPVTIAGAISLSPTGRYAIGLAGAQGGYHSLTDLDQATTILVAGSVRAIPQQVTNTGTVLTAYDQAVVLTSASGTTQVVPARSSLNEAIIDPAGKTLYYSTRFQPPSTGAQLFAVDLASGKQTVLDGDLGIFSLSATADGQMVLYEGRTLRVASLTSGTPRVISENRYSLVTISGDGRIAYGVTAQGGIERIDILTGAVTPITEAPPVPVASLTSGDKVTEIAAGSIVTVSSTNRAPISIVSVCGGPRQSVTGVSPIFQIPFDQPEGPCELIVSAGGYQSPIQFLIYKVFPRFSGGFFTHANFQPINGGSPAKAGEVIVAYMTGLGPLDDRNLLKQPLTCSLDGTPAEILYAGSAPGYPGIYQVNITLPEPKFQPSTLYCGFPDFPGAGASLPVF